MAPEKETTMYGWKLHYKELSKNFLCMAPEKKTTMYGWKLHYKELSKNSFLILRIKLFQN